MAADVGQGTGAGSATVAPGDRRGRIQRVVAPVVPVEVDQLADRAGGEFASDLLDGRRTPVGVPDGGHTVGSLGGGDHRFGIGQRPGQRLLTQDVLAGGEQAFDDLAVQMVGDHDAHCIDVGRLGDRPPVVLGPFISIPACGVVSDGLVGVRDCHQSHVGPVGPEERAGGAVSGGVCASGHATADDGDSDRWIRHYALLLVRVRTGRCARHFVSD